MDIVRDTTEDEFNAWYLRRNCRKHPSNSFPRSEVERSEAMCRDHNGKTRTWFSTARWSVAKLERSEFDRLVFLDCPWTRREGLLLPDGPNYRILSRVAQNVLAGGYLEKTSDPRHRQYYAAMAECHFRLECTSRLAICSATEDELQQNPLAVNYLLDGIGRGLAYMLLLLKTGVPYEPVETFVAERK